MPYPELLSRALSALTQQGHGDLVKLLRHATDRAELHSCLREYIFRTDAKTNAFLNSLQTATALQTATGAASIPPKKLSQQLRTWLDLRPFPVTGGNVWRTKKTKHHEKHTIPLHHEP